MECYGKLLDKRDTLIFTMKILKADLNRHARDGSDSYATLHNLVQCHADLILVKAEIDVFLFGV